MEMPHEEKPHAASMSAKVTKKNHFLHLRTHNSENLSIFATKFEKSSYNRNEILSS